MYFADTCDVYLNDGGVNLSPAATLQPPMRRDRSLSPVNGAATAASRCCDLPRSAPASPSKLRQNHCMYQHLGNFNAHQQVLRQDSNGSGYVPSSVYTRSSYRSKQFPTLSLRHMNPYPIKDQSWDSVSHSGMLTYCLVILLFDFVVTWFMFLFFGVHCRYE